MRERVGVVGLMGIGGNVSDVGTGLVGEITLGIGGGVVA